MDDPVRNPYISESDVGNVNTFGGQTSLKASVRTGQIITVAMIMGVITIALVLIVIVNGKDDDPALINEWILDGLLDQNAWLDCP